MSGGGSTPSAPNLSGNINYANQTAGQATSNAAQVMNTATALNNNSQANLSGVTSLTNNSAGAIANTANQNLNQYGSTFLPLQQTEAQQAQSYGSSDNIARLQGQAISGVTSANEAALANSRAALASEGVDPGSTHGAALDAQARVQGAAAAANAGTQSAIQTQQTAFNMENTANQLGLQVGAQGTQGEAAAAGTAQSGQQVGNQTESTDIGALTAGNTYLNTGVNANNSGVQAGQAGFQDQQQIYQDQQAKQAGIGSLAGNAIGAGLMFAESGGPVPGGIPTRRPATHPRSMGIPMPRGNGPAVTSDYSHGGMVSGRGALPTSPIPGSTDTKPAMLTPGEFVMPKDVVDFKGHDFFHRQIDSIRAKINERRAIPINHPPHVSVH